MVQAGLNKIQDPVSKLTRRKITRQTDTNSNSTVSVYQGKSPEFSTVPCPHHKKSIISAETELEW
jgi:hypothetical protein